MHARFALLAALLLAPAAPALAAPPSARDEVLKLTPPDAALVVVVQNLREHARAVAGSPFAAWFPSSALGKYLLDGPGFKALTDGATSALGLLGVTPADLLDDVLGDAAVFAYSPPTANDPKSERSVILIRPRKPDVLLGVVERLNDTEKKGGALKAVVERKHAGGSYFERQRADGPAGFYLLRDGVFALSQSEADIRAVLDRAAKPLDGPSELAARLAKLGVSDAAAVLLVNPRPLDAEVAAKVKAAGGDERAILTRFAEVWAATDALAVYLALGTDAEIGVSARFAPDKLPPAMKDWLVGECRPSALWGSVPADALFALAGRVKPNDLLAALESVAPDDAKPQLRASLGQTLGPVLGKDKLPAVLDALGPDWGLWLTPPAKGRTVPAAVAAVKLEGPKVAEASKALTQALEYGFQMARVAYNARHADQLELREESADGVVIKSLAGEVFPPGFAPCFAVKGGYLLLATSPDAVKGFVPPKGASKAGGAVPLARFNGAAAREYLLAHGPALAKLLAGAGVGAENELAEQLGNLALVLEPVDRVELLARGDAGGVKLSLRVTPVKPLRK